MSLTKFDFVYVVLTYRNTKDLSSFFINNTITDSKVIVVNSFYDKSTEVEFQRISNENLADFINVENLGYGNGNNKGVEFAINNYEFKFLIISNPDVAIIKMDKKYLLNSPKNIIYAPKIFTLKKKNQNPYIYNFSFNIRKVFYFACIKNITYLKYFIFFINSVFRRIFNLLVTFSKKDFYKIYSCHGSFIIIGEEALKLLKNPFYNDMFLFNEEHFFARKAKLNKIDIRYLPQKVEVKHFEDGSTDLNNKQLKNHMSESYIKYFEYFFK